MWVRKIPPIYMRKIMCGVRKILSIYMGKILRGGMQNSSYIYGKTILHRGTLFLSAFSYIGAILRRGMQNSSYIYGKRSPISVKVYIIKSNTEQCFDSTMYRTVL